MPSVSDAEYRSGDMPTGHSGNSAVLNLRVGELVEVRSASEILATLDDRGELDSLPFMPEMLAACGTRLRVASRAVKLCDTVNKRGMHRMEAAVHLVAPDGKGDGSRCDGSAHGGCQAACLLYWKEAWLKRVDPHAQPLTGDEAPGPGSAADPPPVPAGTSIALHAPGASGAPTTPGPATTPGTPTIDTLIAATRAPDGDADAAPANSLGERYACQATAMPRAAPTRLPWWDARTYVRDVRAGNARPLPMLRSLAILLVNKFQAANRKLLPRLKLIRGAESYPRIAGRLRKTPTGQLGLQPGELVEVKSREEIVATLNASSRNRGLSFDAEMLRYCGTRARVLRRVERIVDERDGHMVELPGDCIILEGVTCVGDYNQYCPRAIYPYWREIWLRRVDGAGPEA
jgi:hypothetical protein